MDIYRPLETGALVFGLDEAGTIVSVFDKAANIRISGRRLVSIVRQAGAMTPMSILCPALLDRGLVLGKGRSVIIKGGVLTAHGWCMEINGSQPFEGIPGAGQHLGMDAHRMDRFEKALHFAGQKDGLLGITRKWEPLNAFARKGREIAVNILSGDSRDLGTQLATFAGLGPGFTPSGDDLISGFLIAEESISHFPEDAPWTRSPLLDQDARAVLQQAAEHTCDAGRTMIRMALGGRFPRYLCEAADKLSRAVTTKEMLAAVTPATRYGHTSGTDALMGLLLHMKTRQRHLMSEGCPGMAPPLADQNHISVTG